MEEHEKQEKPSGAAKERKKRKSRRHDNLVIVGSDTIRRIYSRIDERCAQNCGDFQECDSTQKSSENSLNRTI